MFENVNIDWNLSHEDGSTDFSDEETLEDHPRTLTRTPEKKGTRPMSIFTPGLAAEQEESPDHNNRSHGTNSDWSRSNTSDSGDSPGSHRNSVMPPPPPPQSKKPSICKFEIMFYLVHQFSPFMVCDQCFHLWLGVSNACIIKDIYFR